ncbi:H-2 class II histocompatibility antigen gamma chain-like isoform X1 [Corvus kubaryi]|uniref:H-2 class II histocompatibility antigen gamma chain-like isoform X1 n=1 Tax=Corvus kubaryi TaxID=68294 RepID=UPI001C04B1AE|nr:H-2 class II histocompatibility antigen gamma chain-like isoform X1 [Corvus kubaryi]XP_041870519.1 H-2 class II histocompatibility antigen gamma chain-like isoform X1 [Corvus kubaryi]
MADEQRDLISDRGSGVLSVGDAQRSALRRKAAFSTLSILVALLIAGQAVTIYFVYQQSGQISKLTKTSQHLQLEALQRKLPAGAKPVKTMNMAMANPPMVMRVMRPAPFEDLPVKGPVSNKTEDQVKHLLLQADPSKMFPELNNNLMDNLKRLRSTMTYADWKSFESWMHKWLLFEMAKNPKSEDRKAIPAEKVQTKCQAEAAFGDDQLGRFRPQCDENGDYLPKQCHYSTGFCWCSYKNGTKIEGTMTRGKLNCPGTAAPSAAAATATVEPEEMIFSGVDMLKLRASKDE